MQVSSLKRREKKTGNLTEYRRLFIEQERQQYLAKHQCRIHLEPTMIGTWSLNIFDIDRHPKHQNIDDEIEIEILINI